MGEERSTAMALRVIKEALPVMIPPIWNLFRSAFVGTPPGNGATTNLETIVGSHTERLAQLQIELDGQRLVQLQMHDRIRMLSWRAALSTGLSLLALLVASIVTIVK